MSYGHPYQNPPDDYSTEKDSQRIYTRDPSAYRSRVRGVSAEHTPSSSDSTVFPPVKALSFLHSCGLDAEDLQTLAKLPEHLITTDTLPDLLAEIKKKKALSSSRSSAASARSWEDRSHTQIVEYPLDLPVRQSHSLDRELSQTWDSSWGSDQQTTSSSSNYVVEYNHLKDKKFYYDKQSYDTETSKQKTSAAPQTYSNYSSQSSHLSSRDSQSTYSSSRDGQSTYLSSRDTQPSYLSSRDTQPSYLSSRDTQSSYLSSRDTQSSYLPSRDGQSSHLSSRDGQSTHRSSRDLSQSSQLSSRDLSQPSHMSSRYISQSSQRSSRDISQSSHLSSRDSGLPSRLPGRGSGSSSLVSSSSRDVALPSLLSIRDLAPTSRLSGRGIGVSSKSSQQWATSTGLRVPTRKEASDFHGRTPPVFPYACVLCEITVLSNKDWSVHITGPQHANSQLSLVEKYPQWDQTIQSARRNEPRSDKPKSRTTQERAGTSTSRKGSTGNKSVTSSSKPVKTESTSKCKVVCVKFEVDGVDEDYLRKLLGQFGAIVKLIMFPRLALVEMGTAGQAEDVVKYFFQNPLRFKGVLLELSLSAAFSFLQGSRVVSFSPLPSGEGVSSELIAIAKRFGSVKHSLFLPSRGFVEMADVEESNRLVEHYSNNSLKLKGKSITVSFSSEYQTLSDRDGEKEKSPVPHRRRRSLSPKRRSHSSRRGSPSPKRRSYDSRKRDERDPSSEKSRKDSSSRSRSKKGSPSKDEKSKTNKEENMEMAEEDKDQSDNTGNDSDLEGVAVIADDGEELNSEDEFTLDEDMDYEILDSSDALIEQETLEDVQSEIESNDQIIASDMDASNVEAEKSECVPTVTTLDGSNEEENKKSQEIQEGELKEHQQEEKTELQEDTEVQNEEKELEQGEQKDLEIQEDKEVQNEEKELEQREKKELEQGEQKDLELEEENGEIQHEEKDLEQGEKKDVENEEQELKPDQNKHQGEAKDESVEMEEETADVQDNLENMLILDRLEEDVNSEEGGENEISASKTEEEYGRVLEVAGFPVAKKYSEEDLLKIGGKYGEVSDCCLVRANRKVEKALIEMVNAADAAKLEAGSKKQHIRLGGKILKITVSQKYSRVNEGKSVDSDTKQQQKENNKDPSDGSVASSEEPTVVTTEAETSEGLESQMENDIDATMQTTGVDEEAYGRVLRIRNLPLPDQYTDADFLSIAEPYGTIKRHWMLRLHQTGLIEMENAADAEKVVAAAQMNKITIAGKHPTIAVSTKHAHLNKRYFLYGSSDGHASIESEMAMDESNTESGVSEQPSIQTSENVKESSNDSQDVSSKEDKQVSVADDGTGMEAENSDHVPETQTPKLDPVGTEFVRPVVGYFCNLCNVIYASEEEAKDEHCRTPLHHQKLKEHKEQNGSK